MQNFTGWEYLLIDVANQFGKDKLLFNERIEWVMQHLDQLETLADQADTKPLYLKGVQAIRKAQQGMPTGHLVGFDACCSGLQIMSALTGCEKGAEATGLIHPDVRADAYSTVTEAMNEILGGGLSVSRKDAKQALMTSLYGSKKTPQEIFGDKTPELDAFYEATNIVAPGAWELLQTLLDSWRPWATVHEWILPDGFHARVKVMEKVTSRIEVDELDHASFTYEYYENTGTKKGLSNAANVVHSLDAYLLRAIHRRCNYDVLVVSSALHALKEEMKLREHGYTEQIPRPQTGEYLDYYISQYERSGLADVVILPYINDGYDTQYMSNDHISKLIEIAEGMLEYKPFAVVSVHDEFKCHPNHMNHLRNQYRNILADMAESNVLSDVLGQIYKCKGSYPKLSNNLGEKIRQSNYALS